MRLQQAGLTSWRYSATVPRDRGAALAFVSFSIAGLGLVLRGWLPETVFGPFLMPGIAVAIASCGLAGYSYSRRETPGRHREPRSGRGGNPS